jgi:hypothetical protein
MPYKMFIFAYETGPLGYLVSTRKALSILLAHKLRDARLQLFLLKWAAGICGFNLMPMFLATGVVAPAICLVALLLWLGAGDIFLKFALEDECFYNLATKSHALNVFEDIDLSLPQPGN